MNYLYGKDNQILDITNFKYFNEGMCAKIFKNKETALKVYKYNCYHRYYLTKKMFEKIQELNIQNIVKLYNYYFNYSKFNYLFPMDAYTMEYVHRDELQLLNQKKDYLINTFYSLEKVCLELSKHKIQINDAHSSNIIFNKNGATLIDVDSYSFNKLKTIKQILFHNKQQILLFLRSQIKKELIEMKSDIECYKTMYLFNIDLRHESLVEKFANEWKEDTFYEYVKKNM